MPYDIDALTNLIKNESSTDEVCSQIIFDLENGKLPILKLIEHLGSLLTSQDVSLRRGGIEVLSNVLQGLPPSYISSRELEHLTGYFSSCLSDHHSFIPAVLRGFLALANMENLPDGVASKIFTVLNLNFTCQSQPQADRFVCYQLLNSLMDKKTAELQALGPDFVCGYLSVIDSERDPRNLMYLFERLPRFYQNFPAGHLLEDAFEAVSCYFPVDFRTNPKDPRGISRENLSEALMLCLVAIDDFCPFIVALALDKLCSDLKIAKLDSLTLLKQSFAVFSAEKLCPSVDEITSVLLNELKPGRTEVEVQELCMDVLSSLIKYLSDHKKFDSLNKTLTDAFASVKHFLNDFHLTFFIPAVKFLTKIASACVAACEYVVVQMIPRLLLFELTTDSDVITISESFKFLLVPCAVFHVNCADLKELVEVWPKVVNFFLSHSQSENPRVKISVIEGMTHVASLFPIEERRTLYSILCQNVKLQKDASVRQKCVNCLRISAIRFSTEIKNILEQEFALPENGTCVDLELRKHIFYCWCSLAPVPGFLIYLEQAVKKYIVNDKSEYADFVIEALRKLVVHEKDNIAFLNSLHHDINIIRHLMDWWHEGCNAISDDRGHVFEDEHTAGRLQMIICIIMRVLDAQSQLENAVRYLNLTIVCSTRFMKSFQYLNVNDELSTLKVHCSLSIITFESIVNALLPAVLDQTLNQCLTQIVKYLSTLAVYCSRPICSEVACRSIATIFNKISEGPYLDEEIEYVFTYTSSIVKDKGGPLQENAVQLILFVTKSLLLRGYRDLNRWLDELLILITDKDVSSTVAQGFRMMCREDEYFLNTSCHSTVKLFYRQRLFSYMITKLITNAKSVDDEVRIQCAISAVYLLEDLPQSVVSTNFTAIVPLLAQLLNVHCQTEISLITLQKLAFLLPTNAAVFEEYVDTFIPKLLLLAQNAKGVKVRMVALQCLIEYSKLSVTILLPHKTRVVHELSKCVDDHKRLVRKEAVKARTRWLVMGVS